MEPPAGSRQKEKEREERKAENQKFEAVYNRRVPWSLQPAAGKKREEKERGKPKIRNLRRYIIGGYLGASSRQPAKREGKRKRKTKNQKFEAVYNRRIPWSLQPAAGQKKRKGKGKPKIRKLRLVYNCRDTLSLQFGSRQKKRKGKGQITTGIVGSVFMGLWGFQPAAGQKRRRERGKPKIRNLRRYIIGGYLGASSRQPAKREGKKERKAKNQKFEAVYNRRIPWSLQPAAGKKRRKNREESQKSEI